MSTLLSSKFIAEAENAGIPLTPRVALDSGITTTMFQVVIDETSYTMLTRPLEKGSPQFFKGSPFNGTPLTVEQSQVIFDIHERITSPHERRNNAAAIAILKNMLDNPEKFPTAWVPHPNKRGGHTTRSALTAPLTEPWPFPPVR